MATVDGEQPDPTTTSDTGADHEPDSEPDQDAEPSLNAPAAGRPDGVEDDDASPTSTGDPDGGGMARRPPADS